VPQADGDVQMFRSVLQNRLALISLLVWGVLPVDAYIQSASAQCPPGAKIYIDPRLVPQRQRVTPHQFMGTANPYMDPALKHYLQESYYSQHQPIEVPFGGGRVLVSPDDPCIQQYIRP
jgi:hypothetical protein